ncbi:MAG: M23 family metallopeptidase [Bacteroidota bacterium]|nr:M23 family metallopeptidase [Bacteroidota bacterium]MDW8138032.1 M23 family metallopeptidase [Bacteroidota bacterium]
MRMRIAALFLLLASADLYAQSLLWPTDASRLLGSGFGSDRENRFHMGIDIRTNRHTGYPVYAIADGYVDSVAVSPYGYGKVLYITHPDGYRSVYAHLERFAGELDSLVARLQRQSWSYRVARKLPPYAFPVRAGQVIAYSGDTGSGPPHLHLEYRAPGDVAVDPLRYGLGGVRDRMPPVFYRLAVLPLSDSSRVMGTTEPYVWTLRRSRFAPIRPAPPLRVQGAVGLAVEVIDYMEHSGYRLAVPELELWVEGRRVFARNLHQIPYRHQAAYDLDRDYGLRVRTGRPFVRLWRHPANPLAAYVGTGVLRLPPGRHRLRIIARDVWGNESALEGLLEVADPIPPEVPPADWGARTLRPQTGPGPLIEATEQELAWITLPEASPALVVVYADSSRRLYRPTNGRALLRWPVHPRPVALEWTTLDGERRRLDLRLFPVPAQRELTIPSFEGQGWVRFFRPSLFGEGLIGLHSAEPNELLVEFPTPLLADSFQVILRPEGAAAGDRSWGLYRQVGSGWRYVGSRWEGETLVAASSLPGRFRAMRDTLPPQVRFRPPPRASAQPLLVRIWDERSGIDDRALGLWINGRRQIPVYDPEAGGIRLPPPREWPPGRHEIRVRISDRAGNTVERTFGYSRP